MRKFLGALIAVAATFGILGAGPANAAWQCVGAEYICGPTKSVTQKAYGKSRSAQRATKSAKTASTRRAKRSGSTASASYSPGSGAYQSGVASYYWQPQRVASGGWFNPKAMTAAHKSLPFGTKVKVTHLGNGRSVTVTINDRGPFIKGRIIDLSSAAAGAIGMKGSGVARVAVSVVGRV